MSLLGRDRPVLELLEPDDAALLLDAGAAHVYGAGDVLMSEGEVAESVMIVGTGRVMVAITSKDGSRLVLALRGPGDLLGELSAVDGGCRSATVTALVRTTVVRVPVSRFNEILARRPRMVRVILRSISGRLRDSDWQRSALASASLLQRVAQTLIELADRAGQSCPEGTVIDIPLPQHDLAALTGATREGAAKALRVLREQKIVITKPRRIVITDHDLLKSIGEL